MVSKQPLKLRPYNDPQYRRARAHLTANPNQLCWHGCGNPATTIDHDPPIITHQHIRGTNCCTLRPACQHCNCSKGATEGNQRREPHSGWI